MDVTAATKELLALADTFTARAGCARYTNVGAAWSEAALAVRSIANRLLTGGVAGASVVQSLQMQGNGVQASPTQELPGMSQLVATLPVNLADMRDRLLCIINELEDFSNDLL